MVFVMGQCLWYSGSKFVSGGSGSFHSVIQITSSNYTTNTWCIQFCMYTLCCHFAEPFDGPEPEETPNPPTGSGISGQANKIILTIVAIVSVWAGNILP